MNTPFNIISAKSLEKQLKVVESRMGVLEAEISELQKIKDACLVLLGSAPQTETLEAAGPAVKGKKKKSETSEEEGFNAEGNEVADNEDGSESATVN